MVEEGENWPTHQTEALVGNTANERMTEKEGLTAQPLDE